MAIGYLKGRRIGWWEIDNASNTISNEASGQRIQFDGPLGGKEPIRGACHFTYTDQDFTYPIVAIRHLSAHAGTWVIDHEKSAALWQHETGNTADFPPYGLWRRVDEAVVDALCCWREIEPSRNMDVKATGGWFNGTWQYRLSREFDGSVYEHPSDPASAPPILMETADPAPRWQFNDAPRKSTGVKLSHVRRQNGKLPYLPPGAPLEGFQDETPYLIDLTSGAILFPAYAKFHWVNRAPRGQADGPDELVPHLYFTYADDQAFVTFGWGQGEDFSTSNVVDFGVRQEITFDKYVAAETTTLEDRFRRILRMPSAYPVWRQFTLALQNAWFQWEATSSKIPTSREDFDAATEEMRERQEKYPTIEATYAQWSGQSLDLPAENDVRISERFVAGVFRSMNRMRAYLAPVLSKDEKSTLRALEDPTRSQILRPTRD